LQDLDAGGIIVLKCIFFREIRGSHNSVDKGSSFLECWTVSAGK
jgi:hypothetical protein